MSKEIPFTNLPEPLRPEAARSMLAGGTWMYWGDIVAETDRSLLEFWAAQAPTSAQEAPSVADKVSTPAPLPKLTNAAKRAAVDSELRRNPDRGDRELARFLGVSHRYVALRRRVISGNVATDEIMDAVKTEKP
jgi:hypothetical protein